MDLRSLVEIAHGRSLVELAHGSAGRVSMSEELDRPRRPPTGGARGFFYGVRPLAMMGVRAPARLGVRAPPRRR